MVDEAASMFAGQPQPVEIHHRGIWYSGELLGWRHGNDGRVAARVRCRVDGLRHSAWMDLADLRLPDPERPPHKESFPAVGRRPVPLCAGEEDEATRPHVLIAALRTRPVKPAHAERPPAPLAVAPVESLPHHDAVSGTRPRRYPREREAYVSDV